MAEKKQEPAPTPAAEELVTTAAVAAIEGVPFKPGTVVGTRDGAGALTPTHADVTRGHLEARVADGRIITKAKWDEQVKAAAEAAAKEATAKAGAGKS